MLQTFSVQNSISDRVDEYSIWNLDTVTGEYLIFRLHYFTFLFLYFDVLC